MKSLAINLCVIALLALNLETKPQKVYKFHTNDSAIVKGLEFKFNTDLNTTSNNSKIDIRSSDSRVARLTESQIENHTQTKIKIIGFGDATITMSSNANPRLKKSFRIQVLNIRKKNTNKLAHADIDLKWQANGLQHQIVLDPNKREQAIRTLVSKNIVKESQSVRIAWDIIPDRQFTQGKSISKNDIIQLIPYGEDSCKIFVKQPGAHLILLTATDHNKTDTLSSTRIESIGRDLSAFSYSRRTNSFIIDELAVDLSGFKIISSSGNSSYNFSPSTGQVIEHSFKLDYPNEKLIEKLKQNYDLRLNVKTINISTPESDETGKTLLNTQAFNSKGETKYIFKFGGLDFIMRASIMVGEYQILLASNKIRIESNGKLYNVDFDTENNSFQLKSAANSYIQIPKNSFKIEDNTTGKDFLKFPKNYTDGSNNYIVDTYDNKYHKTNSKTDMTWAESIKYSDPRDYIEDIAYPKVNPDYTIRRLKDGKIWMNETLKYIPKTAQNQIKGADFDSYPINTAENMYGYQNGRVTYNAFALYGTYDPSQIQTGGTDIANPKIVMNQGPCPSRWRILTRADYLELGNTVMSTNNTYKAGSEIIIASDGSRIWQKYDTESPINKPDELPDFFTFKNGAIGLLRLGNLGIGWGEKAMLVSFGDIREGSTEPSGAFLERGSSGYIVWGMEKLERVFNPTACIYNE